MKYNNENLVEIIYVEFIRKNIKYKKDIYLILNNEMKHNLKNPHIEQYFIDCTYYAIPQNNHNYRLLII